MSSVFALTFSPRKYSLLVGARWSAELGLIDAALDPYIERFLRRVRGTPADPVGGIIDMARALDEHLVDRTDPARIAARAQEAAERARARSTLIAAIALALVALLATIFFFVRRGQLRRRWQAFEALADAWDQKVENAAGRYVEFYGKRDAIVGLLELEGKTKALLEQGHRRGRRDLQRRVGHGGPRQAQDRARPARALVPPAPHKRLLAAAALLGRAEHKLDDRHHLDAHRLAHEAKAAFQSVRESADQAVAHLDQLEATRTTYARRAADMDQQRAERLGQLRRYNPDGLGTPSSPMAKLALGSAHHESATWFRRWPSPSHHL